MQSKMVDYVLMLEPEGEIHGGRYKYCAGVECGVGVPHCHCQLKHHQVNPESLRFKPIAVRARGRWGGMVRERGGGDGTGDLYSTLVQRTPHSHYRSLGEPTCSITACDFYIYSYF